MLKFDRPALEFELSRLLGRDVEGPIRFPLLLDLRTAAGAQWAHLARYVATSLETSEGLVWNPLFGAQLSSTLMVGLLLAAEHDQRERLDQQTNAPPPAVIRRAVEIIESRAAEPLTVPQIAAEVHVSVRSLQRGFLHYFGASPTAYLTRVRMQRVHSELVAKSPGSASVSEIALRWGFHHMSRFAADYRSRFGQAPSATLRGR